MTNAPNPRWQAAGPYVVGFGALLWAFDAPFRNQLTQSYSPLSIVTTSHVICSLVLAFIWLSRRKLPDISSTDFSKLIYIAVAGSATAMILFTAAFATAQNFTVPILIQKLQPVFAIFLARLFLKESISKGFVVLAGVALIGAYLLSFEFNWIFSADVLSQNLKPVALALGAAFLWGSTTVVGRSITQRLSPFTVTSYRYFFATLVLVGLTTHYGEIDTIKEALNSSDTKIFAGMALGPGLIALLIYYQGLRYTPAMVATLAELSFPIGTILINWIWLGQSLTYAQITGATLLIASVTLITISDRFRPRT